MIRNIKLLPSHQDIPPITSNNSRLPRLVRSKPEPRVLISPIQVEKMIKNYLDMRIQSWVKHKPIIAPTPSLPKKAFIPRSFSATVGPENKPYV